MDTTNKHIKMCERAEKIQEEWTPKTGDVFAYNVTYFKEKKEENKTIQHNYTIKVIGMEYTYGRNVSVWCLDYWTEFEKYKTIEEWWYPFAIGEQSLRIIHDAIWIPQQYQLQEILIKERKKELDNLTSAIRDTDSIHLSLMWMFEHNFLDLGVEKFNSYKERYFHRKYVAKFASLEQLWIAFVMWELYDKIWDDEKEDWVNK